MLILQENSRSFSSLPIAPVGTNFQLKVWKALQTIPYGETVTYGQLAEQVEELAFLAGCRDGE
ncbi:MAG: MGMT family protein [Odoribacter sp.]